MKKKRCRTDPCYQSGAFYFISQKGKGKGYDKLDVSIKFYQITSQKLDEQTNAQVSLDVVQTGQTCAIAAVHGYLFTKRHGAGMGGFKGMRVCLTCLHSAGETPLLRI